MKPFENFWSQGIFSRQAHRDFPEGTFEREIGREGFAGPATHVYHPKPPTSWESISGPLRPRAFDLAATKNYTHPFSVPVLLESAHLEVLYWSLEVSMQTLVKNADGDMLLFVHSGSPSFYSDYGYLDLRKGDYVVVPRGTMWRVETSEHTTILIINTQQQRFQMPDRGLLGRHALWDPSVLDVPQLNEQFHSQREGTWRVLVRRNKELSEIVYPHNPLDAIGWKGDSVPVRLNVSDLLPVNSHRYHLPPSAHATFECDIALISTFTPRPFETDEAALKVPFFHSNEDIDEVLFYHDGDFFSRDNIRPGCLTLHPSGIVHGPHPKALEGMFEQKESHTEEIAVMIDSKESFSVRDDQPEVRELEDESYADSWKL